MNLLDLFTAWLKPHVHSIYYLKFVFQGRGQVQEQRAGDQQPEAASLPHQVGQVPGKNRVSHQRSPEGLEDRPTEGRHRHLKVIATPDPDPDPDTSYHANAWTSSPE